MAKEIKKGPLTDAKHSNKASEVELFVRSAFLKPLKGQPLHFSTNNEENVLKSMQNSLDQHREETDLVQPPSELELCSWIAKQHLRTSADGLSTMKIDGDVDKQGLAFEIKLLATINSRCSSEFNFLGTEKVTRCTFGDSVFKKNWQRPQGASCSSSSSCHGFKIKLCAVPSGH